MSSQQSARITYSTVSSCAFGSFATGYANQRKKACFSSLLGSLNVWRGSLGCEPYVPLEEGLTGCLESV